MKEDSVSRNRATRTEILARIRAGVGRATRPAFAAPVGHVLGPQLAALTGQAAGSDVLKARFVRHALASSTTVVELAERFAVPAEVARYLDAHGLPRRAALWAELADLDWANVGVAVEARAAQDDDAVGITGVFCAIAETGTLLTLSGPDTAAKTSLLPETHIAVVPVARVVATLEEAFALVRAEHGKLPRALNFISGPSRTGDIEQTIVLGAHGPARVHLILIGS